MKIVGVTGNFCSGKTTVSSFLEQFGARLLNADRIVHRLYSEDKRIIRRVTEEFGPGILTGGKVDRKKLGAAAFKNARKLKKLCRIAHPAVLKKIKREIRIVRRGIIVIDAPLLIESGLHKFMDCVIVVKASPGKALERCGIKNFTKRDARTRITFQMPFREKARYADFIVNNNRTKSETKKEVKRIWQLLKKGE